MPKITLDYDDIVGAFYLSEKDARAQSKFYLLSPSQLETARNYTQYLFDYIERWQQSGMTLESLEDDKRNNVVMTLDEINEIYDDDYIEAMNKEYE